MSSESSDYDEIISIKMEQDLSNETIYELAFNFLLNDDEQRKEFVKYLKEIYEGKCEDEEDWDE